MDMLITAAVFLALLFLVIYKAKIYPDCNPGFFDLQNSTALRAIWCVVVVMVHIPAEYGNRIQDMAGSFAYIGVTFFFLFSGYGLSTSLLRQGTIQKDFWAKRLVKLLVPQFLINIVALLLRRVALGEQITFSAFIWVARWLRWLIACYLVFWCAHKLFAKKTWANAMIGAMVIGCSLAAYFLKRHGIIVETIWDTEVYGFFWGILLVVAFPLVQNWGKKHWIPKVAASCIGAMVLGLLYLKCKPVAFWGDYLLKIALGVVIIGVILLLNTRIAIGNRILNKLGSISYEIYLIHSILISVFKRMEPDISSGVFIVLVLSASVILGAIIHAASAIIVGKLLPESKKKCSSQLHN